MCGLQEPVFFRYNILCCYYTFPLSIYEDKQGAYFSCNFHMSTYGAVSTDAFILLIYLASCCGLHSPGQITNVSALMWLMPGRSYPHHSSMKIRRLLIQNVAVHCTCVHGIKMLFERKTCCKHELVIYHHYVNTMFHHLVCWCGNEIIKNILRW